MLPQPSTAELANAATLASGAAPPPAVGRRRERFLRAREPLVFAALFAFLNVAMNSRFPARQPLLWYLVPSLDVVAAFTVIALFAGFGRPVPRWLRGQLVAWFLVARVLRVADGVEMSAFYRNFNFVVDSPLIGEFVRLFYTTVPLPRFLLACFACCALLMGLGLALNRAFRRVEVSLASPAPLVLFSFTVGTFAFASPFQWQAPKEKSSPFRVEDDRRLAGAFGSSIFSRFASELDFAANIYGYRANELTGIQQQQNRLASLPNDLKKLGGANVYLFVIESYGECVVERPSLAAQILPEYERFQRELGGQGFGIVTRVLDSSTYGGRSWLAHATLSTGVRTTDQFQLELLRLEQPKTLADLFGAAGYRTVLVQPATNRVSAQKDLHHFAVHYYAKDFGYAGPEYGWSPMPDQYVLDYVRRRELAAPKSPLFVEYALTSSHAPWSDLPPFVEDWSALTDGSLYQQERGSHFENGWLALGGAADAYARSVVYDLETLRRYLAEFVQDGSLVIILGDHQPHSEVTDGNEATGVPVHVLSRNPALLEPFRARGYASGMRPPVGTPRAGLETFMTDLVSDFSLTRASGER